jgi:hypothetical protein
MTINLPTPENNSGTNDWSDVYSNDKALKEAVEALEVKVNATAHPITYYEPKVIATEQSTSSTSFTTLATADEITGVVVPENGLVDITYSALVKSSVAEAGVVSLFIGSTQLIVPIANTSGQLFVQAITRETAFGRVYTSSSLEAQIGFNKISNVLTTGRVIGGVQVAELAAGTYAISAKYKAESGSVTAKNRILRVEVHGT